MFIESAPTELSPHKEKELFLSGDRNRAKALGFTIDQIHQLVSLYIPNPSDFHIMFFLEELEQLTRSGVLQLLKDDIDRTKALLR